MWRDQFSLRTNTHQLASPGYVVLMTDYRGSGGYGESFSLDLLGDPLRGPAADIERAADEAIRRYPFIDATRQAAVGASYGAHLVNWLEGNSSRYRCLVSHAGLASWEALWSTTDVLYQRELMLGGPFWESPTWRDQSPVSQASRFKTPMLLSAGERDYRVPLHNSLEMFTVLQHQRIPSRLLVWPDENHWLTHASSSGTFDREVRDWLARWLN
jgi:dipeptidyl aminopeptidase/acylaminoacyl peptidase